MRVPVDLTGDKKNALREEREALKKRMTEERNKREVFLIKLYEESRADLAIAVRIDKLANPIGLHKDDAERAARYFNQHGLVKPGGHADDVHITARGIDVVEQMVMEADES